MSALVAAMAAAHGEFGWMFLDWAEDQLTDDDRAHLRTVAADAVADFERSWAQVERRTADGALGAELGWLEPRAYVALGRRAMQEKVLAPLRERGLA